LVKRRSAIWVKSVGPAAHWASVHTAQVPSGKQHEPIGTGQVVASHGMSAPSHTSGEMHAAWVVIVQSGIPTAVLQQAPIGGGTGQFVVLQEMSAPSHTSGEMHAACVVIVQAGIPTAVLQQAPVGGGTGHVVVLQTVAAPRHTRTGRYAAQSASVVTTQEGIPAAALQQAPDGCAHGFGLQACHCQTTSLPTQSSGKDSTQAPVVKLQQPPRVGVGHGTVPAMPKPKQP
jgi:hypothetical protein